MKNAMVNPRKRIVGVLALFLLTAAAPSIVRVARGRSADVAGVLRGGERGPRKADLAGSDGRGGRRVDDTCWRREGRCPCLAGDCRCVRSRRPQYVLHQHGVDAGRGLLGHVHAARVHVRGNGLSRVKHAAHTSAMNMLIYTPRLCRILGLRVRDRMGELVQRTGGSRVVCAARTRASVLNSGLGLGAATDAAGNAIGVFTDGIIGTKGFFLAGSGGDVSVLALFFFMMVFMDTTATIPTGTMAGRWRGGTSVSTASGSRCLTASTRTGPGAADAPARRGRNWGLGHGAVGLRRLRRRARDGRRHRTRGGVVIVARIGKYVEGQVPSHSRP